MKKTLTMMLVLSLAIITGCRTTNPPPSSTLPVVPIKETDNEKHIHRETIDTVFIEIPAQSAERTTPGKESHLETEYAESDARINEDGTLTHTIKNKPGKKPVPVKNEKDTVYLEKRVEVPVPAEVPKEVERKLTAWEKTRLNTWGWLAVAFGISIAWIRRKQIITLARRFI